MPGKNPERGGKPLSRRDFLKFAALAAAGSSLAACSGSEGIQPVKASELQEASVFWPNVPNKDGNYLVWSHGQVEWRDSNSFGIYGYKENVEVTPGRFVGALVISSNEEELASVALLAQSLKELIDESREARNFFVSKGLTDQELDKRAQVGIRRRQIAERAPKIFKDWQEYYAVRLGKLKSEEASRYRKEHPWLLREGVLVTPDGGRWLGPKGIISTKNLMARVAEWNRGDLSNFVFWGDKAPIMIDRCLGFKRARTQIVLGNSMISKEVLSWAQQMAPRILKAVLNDLSASFPREGISSLHYKENWNGREELFFTLELLGPETEVTINQGQDFGQAWQYGGTADYYTKKEIPWLWAALGESPREMMENMALAFASAVTTPQMSGHWPWVARGVTNQFIYGDSDPWLGIYPDSRLGPLGRSSS